jgi:uncharacterized OsmC-like protein
LAAGSGAFTIPSMGMNDVAAAIQRARTALTRRPDMGEHDDTSATARWQQGVRVVSTHPNGAQVTTDMATEVGGTGDQLTPGWLFRAGLASCSATTIALSAAAEGIELTALEVKVTSRTDSRGFLGMADDRGEPVFAGPHHVWMHVTIAASNATPERLRALVESGDSCAPVATAVRNATPLTVHLEVDA